MSITIILDPKGKLTGVVIPEGDEVLHVVRDGQEAILRYDPERDEPVRGYGRSRCASYDGAKLRFMRGMLSCPRGNCPEQPL